ncbi:putative leucine-rich repeat-containing protein DDB_G0290503 isoform X2 [Heterodontus francisci]|uniref:putative leucine-rich repeat-containing protein DDB_G0290503 isoform X2 n=1 Tax=Heterodontus francisci TaxID=7792 RepID=UPI00355C695D
MMGSKLIKVQSDEEKSQDTEDKNSVQLKEPHTSEEQHKELLTPTEPKKREHFVSFPGELSTDLNNETLQEQLITLKVENKHRGDRIAELEDYILKLQNFQSLAEPEFEGNEAVDNQQILEEKLKEYEVILEERAEESVTLRKKLNKMELSYDQLRFECDALKGKLASVRELESLDSHSSDEETEGKQGAKTELLQRVKNLEGLLKIKEMSEKELTETAKELQGQLLQNQENQRLLSLRCAKLDQLTKQKEDVESKLEERYSQVEQLQKEKERSEEEYQEQIKMLLDEIKERDEAHSQLEAINKDLFRKIGEVEESRDRLESKTAKLRMDLEERVNSELTLKKQCSDLEKTVRDWEHFEQQLNEQFKRVESKQNGKIKSLRKQLEEKDDTLKKTLQMVEELKKSNENAESLLHERQHISPEILKEKEQLEAELSRMAEAEIDKAGFIVKMRSRFEMELNEKSKKLEDFEDEIESLKEEIGELKEQQRQQKEAEKKLQERNKMLEELMEDLQKGEAKILQEKIARMEKLLNMKEETEEKLQVRISKQESLLKEMEETERRLAQRNEELGIKQRGMSEELHRWKMKCCNLEKFEREVKIEAECQRDRINELETAKTNLEVQLQKKINEFDELGFLKKKEQANLTAELNKKIEELEFKQSVCQAAKQNLEMQLKKRMKEFEISEVNVKNLRRKLEEAVEEKQCEIRKVETTMRQEKKTLETQLAQESQLVISLETMFKEECQLSLTLKGALHTKDAALKLLQEEHSTLLARIQALEQDLEEAKNEGIRHTEWETNKREIDVLDRRLEELAQSEKILKQTIDNFIKTEDASQRRIQELELSEQRLLDKINELTFKSQQSMTKDPILTGKLRSLQTSEKGLRIMLTEKEKSEELLKGKQWRLQNQLRMKEDEMKKQSEYFEHYKQKQQQQLAKLREREQSLQSQVFKLDRERINLNATSVVLRTELQQVTAKFTKLEKAHLKRSNDLSERDTELTNMESCLSDREDQIKDNILGLQHDLKKLLEKEEANNQEKGQLRERLQQAEDNEDFLTHKLEDFRSRIHELKLSESSLQEQAEELEEENERLRRELKEIQEHDSYLKEVLEEKERLECLAEEKNQVHKTTLNNSELQLSSDEIPEQEAPLEEEETSPNKYRDLKNSLTHLRSQLQNGDILFREELLQDKWAAVLDSARNKNTQTPSIGQCVQEAMIIAKLASECICGYPKLPEAVKEGRIIPLLEANTCILADVMQVLRTGDVEKVRAVLQSPEAQKELAMLLDPEVGQLASYELSPSVAEKQEINKTAKEIRKCGDDRIIAKEVSSDAVIPVDTITNESQLDQLESVNQKVTNAMSRCLSVHKNVDCTDSDTEICTLPKTHFSMKREPASTDIKTLTETIASLEAEIQQLQTEKAEVGQHLQCRNNQLLKAAEGKLKLEDELRVANSEVSHLSQKLEAITKEKILEKESMKNNLRKENEVLEKRNKELLNGIAKLESNQKELEADFKEKNEEYLQRMSELKDEKSKLEDTISCMQKESAQKLMECQHTVETLNTQNEELKKRLTELESRDKTLANTVTGLKEKIAKLIKEKECLLNKVNELENEKMHIIHQTVHQLTRENEHLFEQVRKLEREVEKYLTESSAAQDKINHLENENTNLMNFKENLIEELKAQGAVEIPSKQDELKEIRKQQSDNLLEEDTFRKEDRKMMIKAEKMCEVKQNPNLMELNVEFNDVSAELSTVKHTGGSSDYQNLGSKTNEEDKKCLLKETGTFVETCLEENAMRKDDSLRKLKLDYDILQKKLSDAEQQSATGDLKLKHEEQLKECPAKKPVTEMPQLTLESNTSLEKLLEKTEMELKSKQEELDKTKAKSEAEMEDLRTENFRMKDRLGALEEHSKNVDSLRAGYDVMKNKVDAFEELQREKREAELLIAPLKAKLSCLIQKCHSRNSLIIQLMRELYQHGITNTGLIEEAEDMLNDTAIVEYTRTFLSSHNHQGNMNTNSIPAGTPKQEQGLNPWFLSSQSRGRQAFVDSNTSLTYRPCVAVADYCPYPNMPHTVLPVLTLSVGDVVHVTGEPDRHGMYIAKVNGELGLVPARFVEEADNIHYRHTTQNKPTASPRISSPERIITLYQQLQHTHSNNYQVASSVTNSEAVHSSLSTPYPSHKVASQPFVSGLHNELEHSDTEACGQSTREGQEQRYLSKSTEQFPCSPGDCSEIPCGQACNDADDLKSILNSGESTSSTFLEMAARSNLSERLASNLKGHSIKHRTVADIQGRKASEMAQVPPAPIGSARIIDTVGQSSLLIDWEKPFMDEKGCSNGTFIQGYRIFIDGEFYKSIMGSVYTKILLEDLDLSVPFQVSIQTVGANGLVSEKVNVPFLNCRPHKKVLSVQPHLSPASHTNESSEILQETSLTLLPTQPKKRMFIAAYNYNPLQDSPNIHPSHEVAFKEGDIIWAYGKQRRDGFCEAEVNGRRGLVPTSLLEDASIGLPKTLKQRATRSVSSPPGHHGIPKISSSSEHLHKQKLKTGNC